MFVVRILIRSKNTYRRSGARGFAEWSETVNPSSAFGSFGKEFLSISDPHCSHVTVRQTSSLEADTLAMRCVVETRQWGQ